MHKHISLERFGSEDVCAEFVVNCSMKFFRSRLFERKPLKLSVPPGSVRDQLIIKDTKFSYNLVKFKEVQ